MFKKKKTKKTQGLGGRIARTFFSIIILTGLVYGLALLTKSISNLDSETFAQTASPILARLGLDEEEAGEVAGVFVERFAQTGINKNPKLTAVKSTRQGSTIAEDTNDKYSDVASNINEQDVLSTSSGDILTDSDTQPVLKIALMADVHEDWDNFSKALENAKLLGVDEVFYLGDFTDWGDIPNLQKGRDLLDESGLSWEALPGDHDLAESASRTAGYGLENFYEVFGEDYKMITLAGFNFLLFDNSANYTPLDEERFTWFLNNIGNADFVVLSQPIYHETSLILMGIVDGEEIEDVNNQRKVLLSKIEDSGVLAVVAADHHRSSISADPTNSDLEHIVVGALTNRRNIQTPRYTIMNIFEDGSYTLDEVIL